MGMYLVIFILAALASSVVSNRLKSKFEKYSQIGLRTGMSGKEIAERMLYDHGITDVAVQSVPGQLTDHYNPAKKTVNLSPEVYSGRSIASAAVAAHECGHAVQHAQSYSMLQLRSALVPIQAISGKVLMFFTLSIMFGGFFLLQGSLSGGLIAGVVVAAYGVTALFSLVTLPVEFDASNRALAWLERKQITHGQEHEGAKDALKWAAMTYVVSALASLATFLYFFWMFFGRR